MIRQPEASDHQQHVHTERSASADESSEVLTTFVSSEDEHEDLTSMRPPSRRFAPSPALSITPTPSESHQPSDHLEPTTSQVQIDASSGASCPTTTTTLGSWSATVRPHSSEESTTSPPVPHSSDGPTISPVSRSIEAPTNSSTPLVPPHSSVATATRLAAPSSPSSCSAPTASHTARTEDTPARAIESADRRRGAPPRSSTVSAVSAQMHARPPPSASSTSASASASNVSLHSTSRALAYTPPELTQAYLANLSEITARCGHDIDMLLTRLGASLHEMTINSVRYMEAMRDAVDGVHDSTMMAVGAMTVFIQKSQLLMEEMRTVEPLALQVGEIKRVLDMLDVMVRQFVHKKNHR